jgi:zinc protease
MSITQQFAHTLHNRTVHRAVLGNRLVVLAVENTAADIIACRIFVRAGGGCESPEQAGVSHLLAAVLTKGTETQSAHAIADRVESVGASLGTDATADYCLLSMKTVSHDFADMLALGAELLRSPSFPEAEVELERRLALQGLRSMQEQPFSVAQRQLRRMMYPNHPYANPILGTEETVAALGREDLQRYHRTYFRPDNLVVSITGRIAPDDAIALVDHYFGDWQPPDPAPPSRPDIPKIVPQAQQAVIPEDTLQTIVMVGHLTPSVHSPDYLVLKVLNTYLGNGLSSRLFVELREKRGLAYEVSAFYPTRLNQSQFVVYLGTAPSNTAIALDGLQQEVSRLATGVLSDDELQAAKNKLLGQYALGKQTNAQLAQIFGWYETLGLGIEFDQQFQQDVATITPAMAQAVAQRYFTQPYVSVVGTGLDAAP